MALAQIYSAVAGHVITAARWNNEFGNIYGNGTDVAFPVTKAVSFAGFTMTIDDAGVTTMTSPSNSGFLFTVGSKSGAPSTNGSLATITASTFTDTDTASSGTAALWTGLSIRTPTLAASALSVTTTLAATLYVEEAPTAGTNQTITQGYAIYSPGIIGSAKPFAHAVGADISSATSIAAPSAFAVVTGTTTVAGISTVHPAGTEITLRFTGSGLNLTHHSSSFVSPYGRDYRTIQNELVRFFSLGSGNYIFYSLNGPQERVGVTIEGNFSATPAGFLPEDGASLVRATYSGLFAEIGTTFGSVDGTHFNVPTRVGRVSLGVDTGNSLISVLSVNGANAAALGGLGGSEIHTLTAHEAPVLSALQENTLGGASNAINTIVGNATLVSEIPGVVNPDGGGSHSNTQPWIAKQFFIRF